MNIKEQLRNKISNSESSLIADKKVLKIIESSPQFCIEQWKRIEEVKKQSEANIISNNKFYSIDIFDEYNYDLYSSVAEAEKGENTGENLIRINNYWELDYFILVQKNYTVRYFISKIDNLLNGDIAGDSEYCKFIQTRDIAYEVTQDKLNRINKLLERRKD